MPLYHGDFIQMANEEVDGRLMMFLLKSPSQDGGQWDMLVNIVEKYGLLPKEYWPESTSTKSSENFTHLLAVKVRAHTQTHTLTCAHTYTPVLQCLNIVLTFLTVVQSFFLIL